MIGAIAGDIIGSVYEFDPIKTKDFPLFSQHCRFTDDTVLTVAVADAVLNGRSYLESIRNIGRRYPDAVSSMGSDGSLFFEDLILITSVLCFAKQPGSVSKFE